MSSRAFRCPVALAILVSMYGAIPTAGAQQVRAPQGTFLVRPSTSPPHPAANLTLAHGQFFSYALPQGWRVGEDGQFALTLIAPDNNALTVMVGNAGLPPGYPADQFAYEKLASMQVQALQLGYPQPATPIAGFQQAAAFPVSYLANGVPCEGVAIVHVATAYDTAVYAMTAALSQASQWRGYSTWLPLVAQQIAATNGAAFGRRGIMQQNLANSVAYGEAAARYREWSQKNWQGVTDARGDSVDRRNTEFRENLGAVRTYVNPYDTRVPVELPTTYKYYWVNPQGIYVGTNDPSVNPNVGSTSEWRKLPLQRQ